MDLKKPVIVLDHEPRQLEELNQAGVDIDLCGHTHDGSCSLGILQFICFGRIRMDIVRLEMRIRL